MNANASAPDRMIRFMQSTTLFKGLSDTEVKLIVGKARREKVKEFDYVFKEKEPGDSLYYILEGQVYLTRSILDSEEFLTMFDKGDTFGETALLAGGTRTATVRAKKNCLLLSIGDTALQELPADLGIKLIRNIAITTTEKLGMANGMIYRLFEQLQKLQPEQKDHTATEDEFVEGLGDEIDI
ncbi:MAG: cyclic nucleotide-binding domain-containing protein [bacterium]|nr:cyclic nucleotide-binding domain-containing protein [bacterium]